MRLTDVEGAQCEASSGEAGGAFGIVSACISRCRLRAASSGVSSIASAEKRSCSRSASGRRYRLRMRARRATTHASCSPRTKTRAWSSKAQKRQTQLAAINSFEAVAREWCGKRSGIWSPVHAAGVLRKLESDLFDEIGDKPIAEINAAALLAAVRKIEARGPMTWRIGRSASPARSFAMPSRPDAASVIRPRDLRGALTPHKPGTKLPLGQTSYRRCSRQFRTYHTVGDLQTELALRLLCLTFVRTNELIGATVVRVRGP